MPYTYVLKCADGSYYTGSTLNLELRLWQHANGEGANYTAVRLPVELVYCEEWERIDDAFNREKQIQGWSRKKKEALMKEESSELHQAAICKNASHCIKELKHTNPTASQSVHDRTSIPISKRKAGP